MLNFDLNNTDREYARKIAVRAVEYLDVLSVMEIIMDLSVVHNHDCGLDLAQFSAADDFNLLHDVVGIHNHLNRKTGKLEDCFVPRFAKD